MNYFGKMNVVARISIKILVGNLMYFDNDIRLYMVEASSMVTNP